MPFIYFSRISENRKELFFADLPRKKSQAAAASPSIEGEFNFKLEYTKLPDRLKSCLDYCSLITSIRSSIAKEKIVRLLLAEGLVPEIPGEVMENVAEMIIEYLLDLGMLRRSIFVEDLLVDEKYKEVCLVQVEETEFIAEAADSPVYVVIDDDGKQIPPNFKSLQIRSLFVTTLERRGKYSGKGLSRAYMESICRLQSLVVLDLNGWIECLPDVVGKLVHLRYLGLFSSGLDEFPPSFSNLQKLQTLDLRYCRLGNSHELPIQILNIRQLRHLLMYRSTSTKIKVPKGFGEMENLQTCDGIYAGGGTAQELGNLIQLQKLGVRRVAEDHADELEAAIMKMESLVSLSLEAEGGISEDALLPEMEQFSPPPLLQELHLYGRLTEIPNWVFSIENLTALYLSFSGLWESQTSVLQNLPKLKHLTLWRACEARCISKAFCGVGGFPELETLKIASHALVEWTEIVNGAFPSLRHLTFRNCVRLKFLPEGLQYISTLEELLVLPVYNDLAKRLNGEENYKIKHISNVFL